MTAKSKRGTHVLAVLIVVLISAFGTNFQYTFAQTTENVKNVPFKIGSFVAPTILLVGQAQGNFNNLSMTTYDLDSGAAALPLMVTGDLAGASDISEPPIVIAFSKDIKAKIIWLTTFTPEALIVKPGVSDLRGRTIGVPGGSIGQYMLEQYLQKHQMSLADIKMADLSAQNIASAFKSGSIDGGYVYPPFTNAMSEAGGVALDNSKVFNYIVFSQQFIDSHPAVVQAFVCNMAKTQAAFISSPSQGWSILSQKLGISSADLAVAMPANSAAPPSQMLAANYMGNRTTPPALAAQIAGIGSWMVMQKRVTKAPSVSEAAGLFDQRFAGAVINGRCP
jgi:ABC-type taurine transport system substrate-binding protein